MQSSASCNAAEPHSYSGVRLALFAAVAGAVDSSVSHSDTNRASSHFIGAMVFKNLAETPQHNS